MQRLLARNRQTKTDGEICWLPGQQETPEPSPKVAGETEGVVVLRPDPQPESDSTPLPGPSHRQDRATVRADLDSLRNIANSAARSAIAKYTTKSTREKILFRTLLLTISFVLATVLLTSTFWGGGNYLNIGWSALAACGALGIDILLRASALRARRAETAGPVKRPVDEGEPATGKTGR